MSYFRTNCLIASLSILLCCSFFWSRGTATPRNKAYADYFLHLYAANQFRTNNFDLRECHATFDKNYLTHVELSFSFYKSLTVPFARDMIVDFVQNLVQAINTDPGLSQRGLIKGRFEPRQLTLYFITTNVFGTRLGYIYIRSIRVNDGEVQYTTFRDFPEIWGKRYTYYESLDFAFMMAGKPRPFEEILEEDFPQKKRRFPKVAEATPAPVVRAQPQVIQAHLKIVPQRFSVESYNELATGKKVPMSPPKAARWSAVIVGLPQQPPEAPQSSPPPITSPTPQNKVENVTPHVPSEELPSVEMPPSMPPPSLTGPMPIPTTLQEASPTAPPLEMQTPENGMPHVPPEELPTSMPAPSPTGALPAPSMLHEPPPVSPPSAHTGAPSSPSELPSGMQPPPILPLSDPEEASGKLVSEAPVDVYPQQAPEGAPSRHVPTTPELPVATIGEYDDARSTNEEAHPAWIAFERDPEEHVHSGNDDEVMGSSPQLTPKEALIASEEAASQLFFGSPNKEDKEQDAPQEPSSNGCQLIAQGTYNGNEGGYYEGYPGGNNQYNQNQYNQNPYNNGEALPPNWAEPAPEYVYPESGYYGGYPYPSPYYPAHPNAWQHRYNEERTGAPPREEQPPGGGWGEGPRGGPGGPGRFGRGGGRRDLVAEDDGDAQESDTLKQGDNGPPGTSAKDEAINSDQESIQDTSSQSSSPSDDRMFFNDDEDDTSAHFGEHSNGDMPYE